MTLEEKVGQTIQAEILNVTPDEVRRYHLGSVLSGGNSHPGDIKHTTPFDWLVLADAFWEASMDGSDGGVPIPVVWGADAVHGHSHITGATIFPHNIGLGAMHNPELIRRIGEITAREMAVTGLDWDFGPTVAVVRNDLWGRTYEGYSEDPEIVREYAEAMVLGLQGRPGTDEFLDEEHVIATAKHFIGDGGTKGGRDQGDNVASERGLRAIHAPGYYGALRAGAQSVMASFSSWRGQKVHGSRYLLTSILRDRIGFEGLVVGDWNAHGQIPGCSNADCPQALNAGVDMYMVPEDWRGLWASTVDQVKEGVIPVERLDEAVRRVLRVKMRAGLFERGKPSSRKLAGRDDLLGSPEHREVASTAVRESLVLLKNQGNILPLRRSQRVLVAGDAANDIGKQSGGWTLNWQGTGHTNEDFPGATSFWDGIREVVSRAGGTPVLSVDGSWQERPDVAIVAFGEDPYAEFVGDLDSLDYSAQRPDDLALLNTLKSEGIPIVSVFVTGRPFWVNPELNASDAFVVAWLPGSEGAALSEVLFRDDAGEVNYDFRGRLSFSWPRLGDQVTVNRGDEDYDPLFPYGFGLRYGEDGSLGTLSEESGVDHTARSRSVFYDAGPVAPWALMISDEGAESTEAGSARTTLPDSNRIVVQSVDRRVQEDARRVSWDGTGEARIYLVADEPLDLTREAIEGRVLSFDVLVEQPPQGEVSVAVGCGSGCRGSLDITGTLRSLPPDEWWKISVRLDCFEEAGADLLEVVRPFELSSSGSMIVRLYDIEIERREVAEDCVIATVAGD